MVREIMAGAAFGGAVKEEIHPGTEPQGPGAARRDPQPGHVGLPRRRHLPDGRRRAGGRRPRPQGPRRRRAARLRRLDHAVDHRRQHQRARDHDRRARRRPRARKGLTTMTLQRPASLTDAFLEQLVARVPSTSGGTLEAHRGLHRRGARRAAAVDARGRRGGVRHGPRGRSRSGRPGRSRSGSRSSSARTRSSSTTRRPRPT